MFCFQIRILWAFVTLNFMMSNKNKMVCIIMTELLNLMMKLWQSLNQQLLNERK